MRLHLRPLLACVLPLLLAACQESRLRKDSDETPPFVFRSLDLKQQDPQGRPAWQLSSPEARYDLRRRLARAERPKGVIFSNGLPVYRLQADNGTVIGDGEAILLEGHLRVERLGATPVLLQAARARWLPRQKLLLVDRRPEAYDNQGRLRANRARFRFDTDTLELSGAPRLERWSKRFDPLKTQPSQPAEIDLQASLLTWKPGSGELTASGPVQGERRSSGSPASSPAQRLSAESLRGNTRAESYTLAGRVHFEDPSKAQQFDGQDVQLDLRAQEGSSSQAFTAVQGSLRATGTGLKVVGPQTLASISSLCHVEQPGEHLDAQRCQWNWSSGAVVAEGTVALNRVANQQASQAQRLEGTLGKDGHISLTAAGSRVVTHLKVPAAHH